MKKIITMLAVSFIGVSAYAQRVSESEVPSAVKTKFESLYPDTKVDKWKKRNGNYTANFDKNKEEVCVTIDPGGKLVKTKTEIEVSDLPSSVTSYVDRNHSGKKISEAYKVTDATGKTMYKAEVDEKYLIFDSNGMFIKEISEKEMKKEKNQK